MLFIVILNPNLIKVCCMKFTYRAEKKSYLNHFEQVLLLKKEIRAITTIRKARINVTGT